MNGGRTLINHKYLTLFCLTSLVYAITYIRIPALLFSSSTSYCLLAPCSICFTFLELHWPPCLLLRLVCRTFGRYPFLLIVQPNSDTIKEALRFLWNFGGIRLRSNFQDAI